MNSTLNRSPEKKLSLRKAIESRLYAAVYITMDNTRAASCVYDLCALHKAENDYGNGEKTEQDVEKAIYEVESHLMLKYGVKDD